MLIFILALLSMPPNPYAKVPIKEPEPPGMMNQGLKRIQPALGERKAIVLLIDFSDNQSQYQASEFDSLIYGENENSMRRYYSEASYGKFTISKQSGIAGWYRAPKNYAYYVGEAYGFESEYPNNAQKLVEDACALADPWLDFSQYDEDNDGLVDAIFIVHAGPGAEETGRKSDIWSHQWQLSDPSMGCPGPYQTDDGVKVDYYSMVPEHLVSPNARITVGVFAHEFGHILGLPDLYDRDGSTYGLGWFCIMAAGSWGRPSPSDLPGSSPSHFCAWSKYQLGWTSPTPVERTGIAKLENQYLGCAGKNSVAFRLMEDPGGADWNQTGGAGEYFLVENRFRTGFDRSLPGDGLLILHCDDSRTSARGQQNDNENHPLVGIMQADNDPCYLLKDLGTAADLWKNSPAGFTDTSIPSSRFYNQEPSGVSVYNISNADSVMTVSFWLAPLFLGRIAAYPNPFIINREPPWGRRVIITYTPSDTVELGTQFPAFKATIYNIAGERVRILDSEAAGEIDRYRRSAFWNLKNEKNQDVVSGMYLYIIETLGEKRERSKGRMTIIR